MIQFDVTCECETSALTKHNELPVDRHYQCMYFIIEQPSTYSNSRLFMETKSIDSRDDEHPSINCAAAISA